MSVTDVTPRVSYNCNGSLESFSFTFPIIESSDLQVILRNKTTNVATVLTETTDYSVADSDGVTGSLANYENGGTITTTVVPPYSSTYEITLARAVPYTQAASFTEGMPSLYKTFEQGLDKLTMALQQLKDLVGRSPYCPADDPTTLDMEMPNAENRAGKYLKFDEDGEPTAVSLLDTDTVGVSAWAETLIDDADAATARATLDVVLDEDDFVSDSEDQAPSQQSALAYFMAKTGANLAIGSDADGDMYYRAASVLARLAKGAANTKMFMNAAGTAPEWAKGIKIASATFSTSSETGDVAYTGAGFKPGLVYVICSIDPTSMQCAGFYDGTTNRGLRDNTNSSVDTWASASGTMGELLTNGSSYFSVAGKSLDADGCTLTWTKVGTPTAEQTVQMTIIYFR
jgi:hypothetical protein